MKLRHLLAGLQQAAPDGPLALAGIDGNLATSTTGTVTAWYALDDKSWAFGGDKDRNTWLDNVAEQYAALLDLGACNLHLRCTAKPYPVGNWTAGVLQHSRVDSPAAEDALEQYAHAADRHMHSRHPVLPVTYLGVEVPAGTAAKLAGGRIAALLGRSRDTTVDATQLAERVAKLSAALRPKPLAATPLTPVMLAELLVRSIGLGLTPPDQHLTSLGPEHLLNMTDRYARERIPYGTRMRYVDTVTGDVAYVAALTVGPMETLEIPEKHLPWLHLARHATFPVEISSRLQLIPGETAHRRLELRQKTAVSQERDYRKHDLPVPAGLARHIAHATEATDEAATARPGKAMRVYGLHRIAVWGATEAECESRAEALTRLYSREAPAASHPHRITLFRTSEQSRILREFVPGEPLANTGYLRELSGTMWAAAAPQVSNLVGDDSGDLIGWVDQSDTPVLFNPHRAMQTRDASGLTVFAADPGGGKSTLMGAMTALAAIRGVRGTIVDPSGPLARLATLPQLAGRVRVIDVASMDPGALAPCSLVPPAVRTAGMTDRDFDRAVREVRAERHQLMLDIAGMLLPPQYAHRDDVVGALREALRYLPMDETTRLDDVMDVLVRMGEAGDLGAKHAGGLLCDASQLPLGELFFGLPPQGALDEATPLVIITMAGLQMPDLTIDRAYWSSREAIAMPVLHAVQLLAARRCYAGSMHRRKMLMLDEAHFLQFWASGRAFLRRVSADSRKYNLAALVASQDPRDILGLDVQNKTSTVFIGRIAADDPQVAAEALRLLRVPDTDDGRYARLLNGLSAQSAGGDDRLGHREFVMRDVDGRVQQIRVDLGWLPGLMEALNTTPDGSLR